MNKHIARSLAALALAAAALGAHAAEVTLTGWAFGSGNQVLARGPAGDYNVLAGGFAGRLAGTDGLDSDALVAYCIELEESFNFSADAMQGYTVVDGASYFAQRRGDAGIAERIGRLMTFARSNRSFNNAAGSTALQLAIWNMVYASDNAPAGAGGSFYDNSPYQAQADALLFGVNSIRASIYDVFALELAGSQDFLVIRPRALQPNGTVPEPGSLALALTAMVSLGGIGAAGRRRRAACVA